MNNEVEWTDADHARIADLWAEGHSTAEIGRRMNRTKNSVVGKAHRLNLPPRPSPIKGSVPGKRKQTRPPRSVKVILPFVSQPPAKLYPRAIVLAARPEDCGDYPKINAHIPAPPRPKSVAIDPHRVCQWIAGEPRDATFCGAPCVSGKSYCVRHCAVAYVRVRDMREDRL